MTTISYAILVNDELEEIKKLVEFLSENKKEDDEIVVLFDLEVGVDYSLKKMKTYQYVTGLARAGTIRYDSNPLNKDFAQQKNYLNTLCRKDYIFNIDADEMLTEFLMENVHSIIEGNQGVDLFWLSRVNKVNGITDEHIRKWGWYVDEDGDVNYPDWQPRIYKNIERLKWAKPVHERLFGATTMTKFPLDKSLAILHYKDIEKQEKQNEFYSKIPRI